MLTNEEISRLNTHQVKRYEEGSEAERAQYASNWRISGSLLSSRRPKPPTSLMRLFGALGAVVFGMLALFSGMASAGSSVDGLSAGLFLFCSSLFGLSVFMWMLGAIEMRLIDINETLKHRR